jgi:hypothetical protein
MDVVSHLLFGRVLSALVPGAASSDGLPSRGMPSRGLPARGLPSRGLTAAIVFGSIVPDADAVLMVTGWDRYLLWHQRGTHAIAGTVADALVFACVLHLLLRLRRSRAGPSASAAVNAPARPGHLFLAAWAGCLGHLLLDLISGGTLRLLSPFSQQPFGEPWMAMADPLLAIPLLLFFIATLIWRTRPHARRFAIATLVVISAIVGVKEVSRRYALAAYQRIAVADAAADSAAGPALEAAWGSWTRWWAFDRHGNQLRVWTIDAWRGDTRLAFTRDTRIAERAASPRIAAIVDASTRLETVQHLDSLFDLTFPEVKEEGDRTEVRWTDIRFCGPSFCALWFGGTFDAAAQPIDQFVIIGTVRQTRAP